MNSTLDRVLRAVRPAGNVIKEFNLATNKYNVNIKSDGVKTTSSLLSR